MYDVCVCVSARACVRLCFTILPAAVRACRAAVRGGSAGAERAALLFSAGQHPGRVIARNVHPCEDLCRLHGRDEAIERLLAARKLVLGIREVQRGIEFAAGETRLVRVFREDASCNRMQRSRYALCRGHLPTRRNKSWHAQIFGTHALTRRNDT